MRDSTETSPERCTLLDTSTRGVHFWIHHSMQQCSCSTRIILRTEASTENQVTESVKAKNGSKSVPMVTLRRLLRSCAALLPTQRSGFEERARYPVLRLCESQRSRVESETLIKSKARCDAAARLATFNVRAPWPVRVYEVFPPAQVTMLDPIQFFIQIIRLSCSYFTIEHRGCQFVRLVKEPM